MGYSKEDCYEALKQAASALGKSPSKSEYDKLSLTPCANEIHRVCESWNAAKKEVGLEVHQRAATYTDQDCIEALQQAAESLGKSPSRSEYDDLDILPGTTTIARHFDGWAEAKKAAGLSVLSPGTDREYTKQECIEALQEAAQRLGHSPYQYEYDNLDIHPKSNTVDKYFGGWNNAKKEAGLEIYNFTREDCIDALQEAEDQLGHSPTQKEYRELGLEPCTGVFAQKFGGWDKAKQECGLNSRVRVTCSEEDCLNALEEAYESLGHSPTTREYRELDIRPTVHEIKVVFGSWNDAKEYLGFDTVPSSHDTTYTKEDCIKALNGAVEKLGISPTMREYTSLNIKPSAEVIKRRFGTWNAAKETADLNLYDVGDSDQIYYGPSWEEQRQRAVVRDGSMCTNCGIELEEHIEKYDRSLHIHHIIRFNDFDSSEIANHLSNLVTVCQKCHKPLEAKSVKTQCNLLGIPEPSVDPGTDAGQQTLEEFV